MLQRGGFAFAFCFRPTRAAEQKRIPPSPPFPKGGTAVADWFGGACKPGHMGSSNFLSSGLINPARRVTQPTLQKGAAPGATARSENAAARGIRFCFCSTRAVEQKRIPPAPLFQRGNSGGGLVRSGLLKPGHMGTRNALGRGLINTGKRVMQLTLQKGAAPGATARSGNTAARGIRFCFCFRSTRAAEQKRIPPSPPFPKGGTAVGEGSYAV
jgi:hypothetical protein